MALQKLIYSPDTISIYIHWPYCLSKCPYCDFNSYANYNNINYEEWEKAYIYELYKYSLFFHNKTIKTLFFGGGTPSLMSPKSIEKIINVLYKLNSNIPLTEVTLECNPSTIEKSKLKDFKSAGINRVSIGIQSFNEKNLNFLKRNHSVKEAVATLVAANSIFDRVSFDLISGLPGQTLNDWEKELVTASKFITTHVSIYELTIEPGTKFFKDKIQSPIDDLAIDMFNYSKNYLEKYDLFPYEISNYAKPGYESLHNLQYWQGGLYLGIGPGAHSRVNENDNIYALAMYKNPNKWLKAALSNKSSLQEKQLLSKEQRIIELFLMNLRLYKNIPNTLIKFLDKQTINFLIYNKLINNKGENYKLTHKGRLQLNSILTYIVKNLFK